MLAVIVILVVIALIATPIIINIIEKSKKSSFEDSVYGVMEAAKLKYTENILDNKSEEKTYLIEDGLRELEYSGKVDGKGVLKIDKTGKIELAIYNDKWCIRKSKEESKLEVEEYKDKCIIPGVERDPVITLNGEPNITLKSGEDYEEQGVIAKTVEGKELEYTTVITLNDIVVESVDTSKTGSYKITYSTSSNGKTATVIRTLTITDGIGPVITFDPEIVNVKSTEVTGYNIYIGVNVEDNIDGRIEVNSENVKTRGELGEEIGEYQITYIVKDSNDNVTEKERIFHVVEAEGPTLNFSNITTGELWTQEQEITIYANDTSGIKEFSYEVYKDGVSSGVNKVEVSGNSVEENISLSETGRYTIKLRAKDIYENESEIESGVYQIDVTPPILTVKSTAKEQIDQGRKMESIHYFNEPIYSLSGGSMSCNPANTSGLELGEHTIACTVTGGSGKTTTATKLIEVAVPPNAPNLATGLIPIKWNGSTWIKADPNNPIGEYEWYDYNKQMWANGAAVTSNYRNVAVGTEIPESVILAYFVWIPRYEYQYTNLGTNYAGGTNGDLGEIKVNFISQSKTSSSTNSYKVHPAFTFGGKHLSGIWVGKFETTGNAVTPTIKPNLTSLTNQNVSTEFATARKFSASGNTYGISTSADSHMMKNSEWGAVAYLSQSKYGKYGNANYTGVNKEVYINNYWNNATITGCSGGRSAVLMSKTCAYTYEKETIGTGASTTGTIYGVYDMSGGAWEYVMGVYRGSDVSSTWGASGYGNSAGFNSAPAIQYYDAYTGTIHGEGCEGEVCYGHALGETLNWNGDEYFAFVSSTSPWFIRGGAYNNGSGAGVFASTASSGDGGQSCSFRVVIR